MSNDFFDAFEEDGFEADWSKVTEERVQKFFDKLSEQDAERVFSEMKKAIETNNKRKALISVGTVVLQEAVKLGLKAL